MLIFETLQDLVIKPTLVEVGIFEKDEDILVAVVEFLARAAKGLTNLQLPSLKYHYEVFINENVVIVEYLDPVELYPIGIKHKFRLIQDSDEANHKAYLYIEFADLPIHSLN